MMPTSDLPSALDDYWFDLRGYLVLENVLGAEQLAALNGAFDRFPDIAPGDWVGNSQRRDYTPDTGYELHNCLEFDPAFDDLIDHPGWISHARRYAGEASSYTEGVFIDECIATIRTAGGHHPVHSGGYHAAMRTQYRYEHGVFRCGQVNVLVALRDVGRGDGPTMVIPGSHKSNFAHPLAGDYARGDRMDDLPGAIPAYLKAGDALLFVDSLMHGAASRTNDGERRIVILRYGPSWARTRFGYEYSNGACGGSRREAHPTRGPPQCRLTLRSCLRRPGVSALRHAVAVSASRGAQVA
jgi:ectoine hydroxylase-related dioxygenase (phytanoyl-CoA dioxygenase family)